MHLRRTVWQTRSTMKSESESCAQLCNPIDCTVHEFSKSEYWSGEPFPSPGELTNPGIKSRSPTLKEGSLPAEPQGKSKNTGVGSLSFLQQIFLTQKSNQGLLHCRHIFLPTELSGSMTEEIYFSFIYIFQGSAKGLHHISLTEPWFLSVVR